MAQSVTLSRSDTFADALSGSALAAAKHGPLLLTPPTSLNANTKAEITRVLGASTTKTVYILGGTGAVSAGTETAIKNMGYKTKRLAGADRYATSIAIANAISTAPQILLVATGRNFPDALSAGAAAGSYDALSNTRAVVVLTNDGKMPGVTDDYLSHWDVTVPRSSRLLCAVGYQAGVALSNDLWSNYLFEAGSTRYVTAERVATTFFAGEFTAGVTTGLNWPDALAGGALLGSINGPLLLASGGTTLNAPTATVLDATSGSVSIAYIFGGTLPTEINSQIGDTISGPAGYDSTQPQATSQPATATPSVPLTVAQVRARTHTNGAARTIK